MESGPIRPPLPPFQDGPPLRPPPPPPSRGAGKIIAVLLALSLLSGAICAGVIFWMRRGKLPGAAGAPAASASAEVKVMRAVVTLPANQTKAVMRQRAAFDAPVVVLLPAGTAVEMTNSTTVRGQTWCRVRTIDFQPAASGWMHGDVLKFQ
jgi:hypothetical protein